MLSLTTTKENFTYCRQNNYPNWNQPGQRKKNGGGEQKVKMKRRVTSREPFVT